jgi:hypothetical protein
LWLGGDAEVVPYAVAALAAAILVRFFSSEPPTEDETAGAEPAAAPSTLGLIDDTRPPAPSAATASAPERDLGSDRGARRDDKNTPLPPGLLDW